LEFYIFDGRDTDEERPPDGIYEYECCEESEARRKKFESKTRSLKSPTTRSSHPTSQRK
jgi:hypothetical protein